MQGICVLALPDDGFDIISRFQQHRQFNPVAVGKAGFFAEYRTHSGTLLDTMTAFFNDAAFHDPRFKMAGLKINIRRINRRTEQPAHNLFNVAILDASRH